MLKDNDVNILYHSGKGNIVVDSFNWLPMGSIEHLTLFQQEVARYVHKLDSVVVFLINSKDGVIVLLNSVKSPLVKLVK